MGIPAIEITGLTKSYGDTIALDGINMKIKKGEFFGLLGPNGAGKTTTINILTGLVFRNKGSTKVFGRDTVKDYRYTRSKIGIAAQEFSVDWFFPIEKLLFSMLGITEFKRSMQKKQLMNFLIGWDLKIKEMLDLDNYLVA